MEETTLGFKLGNGDEVNMQIGIRDWNAQCALVEDALLKLHEARGGSRTDAPDGDIVSAAYCVRHMRDSLLKLDDKVDQLIDENTELAGRLDTAASGIDKVVAINKALGAQNEELRERLSRYEGNQNAPPE